MHKFDNNEVTHPENGASLGSYIVPKILFQP